MLALSSGAQAMPVAVPNGGFETPEATGGYFPAAFADWNGDLSEIVTAENGIVPAEGSHMLRFLATSLFGPGGISSDIWQTIDLSPYHAAIAGGGVTFTFSALFNRVSGNAQSEPQFSVLVRAFDGAPDIFAAQVDHNWLAQSFTALYSDALPSTWEIAATSLVLPPTTTYVGVLIAARETLDNSDTMEFDGHYVDGTAAEITVVPEPATLWLLVVGAVAARRRAVRTTPTIPC